MLGCERRDLCWVTNRKRVIERNDSSSMACDRSRESSREVFRSAHFDGLKLYRKRLGRGLCLLPELGMDWISRVCERGHARYPRENVLQQLQAFSVKLRVQEAQPRQIPARPGKARNESTSYRISDGHHDNGNCTSRTLSCECRWRGCDDQDVNFDMHQFGQKGGKSFVPSFGPTDLQGDGPPFHITQLPQPFPDCLHEVLVL